MSDGQSEVQAEILRCRLFATNPHRTEVSYGEPLIESTKDSLTIEQRTIERDRLLAEREQIKEAAGFPQDSAYSLVAWIRRLADHSEKLLGLARCSQCNGIGGIQSDDEITATYRRCDACKGTGVVL